MEFKTQTQVNSYIQQLGVFMHDNKLYLKNAEDNYICINNKRERLMDYIENNTSPLSEITVTFPIIDLKIFDDYNNRNRTIEENALTIEELKESKKFLKKNWRLIKLNKPVLYENERIHYIIYDLKGKQYQPLRNAFIEPADIKKSYQMANIVRVKNLIHENFKNQYEQAYQTELKNWDRIPVNNAGGG